MPIPKHLRHFYRGPEYRAARERVVQRSRNECEECRKPNGEHVRTRTGQSRMFWALPHGPWVNQRGWRAGGLDLEVAIEIPERVIRVVCTMAHLDHDPANNAEENTRFLCQWCHLNYDKLHHKETRSMHKDQRRPLLAEAS